MKKGFTLAEVLITLAIIGVVAALTIPVVVHKYQQKALYTQFMKVYNTLQNAMQLAVAEEGSPYGWDYSLSKADFIDRYITPYVKNQGHDASYRTSSLPFKSLSGENIGTVSQVLTAFSMPDYLILDDGSAITSANINSYSRYITLIVDTNGVKGPNTMGRDDFLIHYGYDTSNKKPSVGFQGYTDSQLEQFCNVNGSSDSQNIQGQLCGAKLLKEGKMNY